MTTSIRRSASESGHPGGGHPLHHLETQGCPAPHGRLGDPHGTPEERLETAIARIGAALRAEAGTEGVLAEVAAAANLALGGDGTMIWAPCGTSGALELVTSTVEVSAERQVAISTAAEGTPELRQALGARKALVIYGQDLRATAIGGQLSAAFGAGGLIAAPVHRGEDLVGVLAVTYRDADHGPAAALVAQAMTLAGHVAPALAVARGDEETDAQLRAQRALHQISDAMVSGSSVDAVLQQIAESSLVALCADRFTVWRYHPEQGTFVLGAEAGVHLGDAVKRVLQAAGSGALKALHDRQPTMFRKAEDGAARIGEAGQYLMASGFDTIAVWPVMRGDEPLGVLCGCYRAEFWLQERDLGLGAIIANHAAASLHAAEMHERTLQRAAELQALTDMGRIIAEGTDAGSLGELAEAGRQAVLAESLTVWLRDVGVEGLRLGAFAVSERRSTEPAGGPTAPPAAGSPQWRAAREQRVVRLSQADDAGARQVVAAPIVHNGVTLGVVSAEYPRGAAGAGVADGTLQSVASHICYALVGLRLQVQVASHEREVTALRTISDIAASSSRPSEILEAVRSAVRDAVQAAYCNLWLYDTATDGLHRVGTHEAAGVDDAPAWLPAAASPLGHALRTGSVAINTSRTPDLPPHVARRLAAGAVQSVLLLPIGGLSEPLGVLSLGFARVLTLADPEVLVATALAGHAAIALGRANALEDYRVTEERLRMVSVTSSDLTYSLVVSDTGALNIEWISEGLHSICGYSFDELMEAGGWQELVHPEDRARFFEGAKRLVAGHVHVSDYRIVTRSGDVRIMRDRARPIWSEELQRTVRVVGAARDVTDEVRTQQALEALERVAPATLDALSAQIAILDAEGTVLAVNRSWGAASRGLASGGLTPPLGLGANYLALCDAYRGAMAAAASRMSNGIRLVMAGSRSTYRFEYNVPGEEDRWLVATVTLLQPEARSVVVAHEDITDRKRAEEALARQAHYDALTNLPNRTMLLEQLELSLAQAPALGTRPSLLIMDLDRFKEVNDSFGHETGDVLLGLVADRLTNALQEQYLVARLGGDEFAVLVPGDEASAAPDVVADNVVMALRPPFLVDGLVFDIQGSVGVASYPEHGLNVQTLLRRADVAMYVAKHTGTGRAIYTPEQDRNQPRRLSLLAELRRAIDEDQLRLVYHPQVELRSGEVAWVEALVRWSHPTLGTLPPDEFVPIAEQSGLIYQLTRWILRRSLRQAASWHRQGVPVGVAVNMSARDLQLPSLPDFVAASLTRYRVPASRLKIEITESSLIDEPDQVLRGVSQLRARGVKVVLDDFGMGYASLTHLKRLPVDELKIDKSFVRDLRVSDLDAAIVRMTIELGHQMGASVVAEGVEDAETHQVLMDLGCDAAQGFYLAEPAPPDRFRDWMLERTAVRLEAGS